MGRRAVAIRRELSAAVAVLGLAIVGMVLAPDNVIDVKMQDVFDLLKDNGVVALAVVPAFGVMDFDLTREPDYADAQLVGQVFSAEDLGDFLVCGTTHGHVLFYQVETCDLGRMEARMFNAAVRHGLIQWRSDLGELVNCPQCGQHVEIVTNGLVNREAVPFVMCTACAFAEELV
jgi:hypothetical protein